MVKHPPAWKAWKVLNTTSQLSYHVITWGTSTYLSQAGPNISPSVKLSEEPYSGVSVTLSTCHCTQILLP